MIDRYRYKILIVIDMQIDFITDALANKEAQKIVPNVIEKIKSYQSYLKDEESDINPIIIYTKDTHEGKYEYLRSEEGKNLHIPHCLRESHGWNFIPEIQDLYPKNIIEKSGFGSIELANKLISINNNIKMFYKTNYIDSIELIGVCTDICVISNAIIAKSALPNIPIYVDASCCAGVTPESHKRALESMKSCHIHIINE